METNSWKLSFSFLLKQDFQLSFFLRQKWHDSRLSYGNHFSEDDITLGGGILQQLWMPETYFVSKKGSKNTEDPNFFVRIFRNGTLLVITKYVTFKLFLSLRPRNKSQWLLSSKLLPFSLTYTHSFSLFSSSEIRWQWIAIWTSEISLSMIKSVTSPSRAVSSLNYSRIKDWVSLIWRSLAETELQGEIQWFVNELQLKLPLLAQFIFEQLLTGP